MIPDARFRIESDAQPDLTAIHRHGWAYALDALAPLHHRQGVWLDSFVERSFLWKEADELKRGRIPYRHPWVGILHNPPDVPAWHDVRSAPATLLAKESFCESLRTCRGLFVLSEYVGAWLRQRVDVPVVALRHPSPCESPRFTLERSRANQTPRLVQIGWWLRRLHSIAELPLRRLRKTMLLPNHNYFPRVLQRERDVLGKTEAALADVDLIPQLANDAYDEMLAANVAFVHLFDSSANNAIIECIARHTPIVVNRLPAVVEYLGAEYPLYFDTLEEAAAKAECPQTVAAAHRYLVNLPKDWLSGTSFREAIVRSSIYRALPNPAPTLPREDVHS